LLNNAFLFLSCSRGTDVLAEVQEIKDIQKRLALNSTSLPSVCCYTFHNTHDRYAIVSMRVSVNQFLTVFFVSLNCLTMSEDSSLIAGGFSESYVKIWSLKGEKLRSLKSNITPAKVNDCKTFCTFYRVVRAKK
jgi:transcription initiation factor TFIID subunit 5